MQAESDEVARRLEAKRGRMVDLLKRIIRIPSVNPPGDYREISEEVEGGMAEFGLGVKRIETPEEILSRHGLSPPRINVIGSLGSGRPEVLLLAHLDTVPVVDASQWSVDPFGGIERDGMIFGRGASDCKGRIASYLAAASVANEMGFPGTVTVAATADEEIGGETGAGYLIGEGILRPDYCIGEGYTYQIYRAFKGLLWLEFKSHGKASHGSRPELGVNAIVKMNELINNLVKYGRSLSERTSSIPGFGWSTMNIGTIVRGSKTNVVPDECALTVDMRIVPEYGVQRVQEEIGRIVDEVNQSSTPGRIDSRIIQIKEPVSTPEDSLLVGTVKRATEAFIPGGVPVEGWFAHSDTYFLMKRGIPSVNYGAGRAGVAHTKDEHILIDDLLLAARVVALSIIELGREHRLETSG